MPARHRRKLRRPLALARLCPPRDGPYAIASAIPHGSRRVGGPAPQRDWLRAVLAAVEAEPWYANRKAAYGEIARVLSRHMDWRTKTTRPGHAALGAAAGRSPDTVARAIAWLREHGYAGLVSPGWTSRLRAASLVDGEENRAAVYVLTMPRKSDPRPRPACPTREFADLTRFSALEDKALRTREAVKVKSDSGRPPAGLNLSGTRRARHAGDGLEPWPLGRPPQNRADGICAAQALQARVPVLGGIGPAHLRHVLAERFAAGWSPLEILHALDHPPDGREHGYTAPIRHLPGWIRARLEAWPADPPSAAEAARRAREAAQLAELTRRDGPEVDAAAHANRARELLRAAGIAVRPSLPATTGPPESGKPD